MGGKDEKQGRRKGKREVSREKELLVNEKKNGTEKVEGRRVPMKEKFKEIEVGNGMREVRKRGKKEIETEACLRTITGRKERIKGEKRKQ